MYIHFYIFSSKCSVDPLVPLGGPSWSPIWKELNIIINIFLKNTYLFKNKMYTNIFFLIKNTLFVFPPWLVYCVYCLLLKLAVGSCMINCLWCFSLIRCFEIEASLWLNKKWMLLVRHEPLAFIGFWKGLLVQKNRPFIECIFNPFKYMRLLSDCFIIPCAFRIIKEHRYWMLNFQEWKHTTLQR